MRKEERLVSGTRSTASDPVSQKSKIQTNPDEKPDGTKCTSPAENAEVFRNHFAQLYKKQPTNRDSIDEQLNQLPIRPEMDDFPTDKEINLAIQQSNNSAAGASGIRSEIYKALATNPETFSIIRRITHDFWTKEKKTGGI